MTLAEKNWTELTAPLRELVGEHLRSLGLLPPDAIPDEYLRALYGGVRLLRGEADGVAQAGALAFDSGVYGRDIRSLACSGGDGALVAESLRLLRGEGAEVVFGRAPLRDAAAVRAFEAAGFRWTGTLLTMALRPFEPQRFSAAEHHADPDVKGLVVQELEPEHAEAFAKQFRGSFTGSHLYGNPVLPASGGDELHERWIGNDLRGRAAFSYGAFVAGRPAGFITCLRDAALEAELGVRRGIIDLVGVDPEFRSRGVGQRLTGAALDRFFADGAELVNVGTQATNFAAAGMYRKFGFRDVSALAMLHWWADADAATEESRA